MGRSICFDDYVGKKFAMLTVLNFQPYATGQQRKVLCQCECGKVKEIRWDSVKSGAIRSCGCLISKVRIGVKKPKTASDLAGKKFGRLTGIKQEYMERGAWYWSFLCDCGNTVIRKGSLVKCGNTSSCGCAKNNSHARTHGMSSSPEYQSWCSMKDRCLNPNNKRYFDYGGRGITVCDRWIEGFDNFFADMGERPEPKHKYSIERIDNSLGYSPENCKWSSVEEQAMNKRNTVYLTLPCGSTLQTKTIKEWSEITGLSSDTIRTRRKRNWPADQILEK